MRHSLVLVLPGIFLCCLNAGGVFGLRNVTVDDSDPSIEYSPGWTVSTTSNPLDYGGFHHLSDQPTAEASFVFTGVAIYFLSPLWPYAVAANLSLDSTPGSIVSLQDPNQSTDGGPETVNTSVVWEQTGLMNAQHTLVVSFAQGSEFVALDALMYTVQDASDSNSTGAGSSTATGSSSSSSALSASTSDTASSSSDTSLPLTTSASSASSSSPSSNKTLPIALGTALGVVGLSLLIILLLLCCGRRNRSGGEGDSQRRPFSRYSDSRPPTTSFAGGGGGEASFRQGEHSTYTDRGQGDHSMYTTPSSAASTYSSKPQAFPRRYVLSDNPVPPSPGGGGGDESFERSYSTGEMSSRRYDRTPSAGAQRMSDIPEARDSPSPTSPQEASPHSPQNETGNGAGMGMGMGVKQRPNRVPVPSLTGSANGGGNGNGRGGTPRGMLKADFVGRMHHGQRQSQIESPATYA